MTRTKIADAAAVDLDGNGLFYVIAETKEGARFILAGYSQRNEARAQRMAAKVQAAGSIDADLWVDHWPRYGSEAFHAQEVEASDYANAVRLGMMNEADVPEVFRSML